MRFSLKNILTVAIVITAPNLLTAGLLRAGDLTNERYTFRHEWRCTIHGLRATGFTKASGKEASTRHLCAAQGAAATWIK